MKKSIFSLLIIILPILFIAIFIWFLYGYNEKDLADDLTASLLQKKTVSLKVDLGQDNVNTEKVLERSEINILDPEGNNQKDAFDINLVSADNGEYELKINPKKPTLRPGHYYVSARFVTDQGVKDYTQDFYWGVLALNFDKSAYKPGETAYMQMAVLDDFGNTLCRADLELKIIDPKGQEKILITADNSIVQNKMCRSNNVIDEPDYYSRHLLYYEGIYKFVLTAQTPNGTRSIQDFIEVKKDIPFEVQRKGPTRIFPPAEYGVEFSITPNQNFKGEVIERVPNSFKIIPSDDFSVRESGEVKEIIWSLDIKKGETYSLKYTFDAPDTSPEFYFLGPLSISSWAEERYWQIASDATLSLWVAGFGNEDCGSWTLTGTTPYLDVQDQPTNYISDNSRNANCGNFTFETAGVSGGINSVYLYIYAVGVTSSDFSTYLDGADTGLGPPASWNWVNVDVSASLTSWSAINAADILFDRANTTNVTSVDAAYLYIDYDANSAPSVSSAEDGPEPVEAGKDISFYVNWSDADAEGVKMIICKTNSITAANPPTCPGDSWCSDTDSFDNTTPLSCNYRTSTGDIGNKSYYAFVCDDAPECSTGSGGTFEVVDPPDASLRFDGDLYIDGDLKIE